MGLTPMEGLLRGLGALMAGNMVQVDAARVMGALQASTAQGIWSLSLGRLPIWLGYLCSYILLHSWPGPHAGDHSPTPTSPIESDLLTPHLALGWKGKA